MRVWRAWDRFLFEPVSPVPIAIYRILYGTLVLANGLLLLPDVDTFFGPHGVLPPADARRYAPGFRLDVLAWLPDDPFWLHALFALYLTAGVALTAGFFTRLSSAIVFVCLASFHHRNMAVLNSADTFMRLAAFYLIFSPAGRALSLDRRLRVRRGTEAGEPAPAVPIAQRLLQIQLAVAYLATFRWKVAGFTWTDGTAVYYATRLIEFGRFPVPFLFEHGWSIKLATWGTLAVEFALGALVWFRPLRYPILLAGLFLHLGLEYSMNIPLFQWVMLTAYILFVDPKDVRQLMNWLSSRQGRRGRAAAADYGVGL